MPRHKRLAEDFGFRCDLDWCSRVKVNWSAYENNGGRGEDGIEDIEEEGHEDMPGSDADY